MTETVHLRAAPELPSEPPPAPPRRHLLGISDLDRDDIERLLGTAATIARSLDREVKKLPALRGRLVVNLFYESSTRTLSSFDLAAKRLSADTMAVRSSGSSVDKGESLKDTALTLAEYDPDVIVIRHPHIGAPQLVAEATRAHVVNAGDGKHQHPTQALLDLYTMREALGRLDGPARRDRRRRPALARRALADRGARARRRAHDARRPADARAARDRARWAARSRPRSATIGAADVVYVLRMQRERMLAGAAYVPSLREYAAEWGITPRRLRPGQIVMHPGPMNRGVEIDPRVADSDVSLITEQVRSGLVVRMAVLYDLLAGGPIDVARGAGGRMTLVLAGRARRQPHDPRRARDRPEQRPRRRLRRHDRGRHHHRHRARPSRRPAGSCSLRPSSTRTCTSACPGREDEETIASGTAAAAAGGYCAILAMPNTDPVVDSAAVLGALIEQAREEAAIPTGFMASISKGLEGEELTEMAELARLGAAAFTDDGRPVVSAGPDAARAPVQRRHGPDARAARGGADALARRADARRRGLGRARARRLAVGGGVGDDRARLRPCRI